MNLPAHVFLRLLGHATTLGIRTGRFDPAAPNRHPADRRTSARFNAQLGAIPVRVSMSDWRFDEARIAVAAWPTHEVDQWIEAMTAKNLAGDVTAIGYLERWTGRLRLSNPFASFVYMRQNRHAALSSLSMPSDAVDPLGLYPRYLSLPVAA